MVLIPQMVRGARGRGGVEFGDGGDGDGVGRLRGGVDGGGEG